MDASFNDAIFQLPNTSLDDQYTTLVSISVNSEYSDYMVLVDILESALPTLESILLNSIILGDSGGRMPKSVHNSRVKNLDLVAGWDHLAGKVDNWNKGFRLILNLCPNLEIFKLDCDGIITDTAYELELDFCDLEQLQKIDLDMI